MKALRVILAVLLAGSSLTGLSQNQQGYVKTLGRPNQKGQALSGVSVRAKGAHNAVLSKNDGTFTMVMTGKKDGDSYALQQVQKTGYELNDVGMIGRQYAFSTKVPITIVMVSQQQLQEDKLRIENKAYEKAEKNYKDKLTALEQQKKDNQLTEEKYRQQLQDLQNSFSKYESMIGSLAEHYARTDYDELDEKEREINLCIEKGELERADSMLHTIFDPTDVLKRNKEIINNIEKRLLEAQKIKEKAQLDMAAVLKQQEKDAEYLFQLYTIALARFDNEKAGFYIETRAELDTTNIKWQSEAGLFIQDYLADYEKAYSYHNRALLLSLREEGEMSLTTADAYNNVGTVIKLLGNYNAAYDYMRKSADIKLQLLGENAFEYAESLINIGELLPFLEEFEQSVEYTEKGLNIFKRIYGEQNRYVAVGYYNLGMTYERLQDYDKAYELCKKALEINQALYGNEHLETAAAYNNIGLTFFRKNNFEQALNYYDKALEIWEKVLGESHPYVATCYSNIGSIYEEMNDSTRTIDYFFKALEKRINTLGKDHILVAQSYNAIGEFYYRINDFSKALEYMLKALNIRIKTEGEHHPHIALTYYNIGLLYYGIDDEANSISYLRKSYNLYKELYGEEDPSTTEVLTTIKKIEDLSRDK